MQGCHLLDFVGQRDHPLALRKDVKLGDTFAFPFAAPARIPPRLLAPMLSAKSKSADSASLARPFPTIECNVVSAVKRVVEGSVTLEEKKLLARWTSEGSGGRRMPRSRKARAHVPR